MADTNPSIPANMLHLLHFALMQLNDAESDTCVNITLKHNTCMMKLHKYHWRTFVNLWLFFYQIWNPCYSDNGLCMMTSSNGTIFRVTGPLCGEFTGPGEFPHKGQLRGALMFSYIWINDWVNNREAGDLRLHRGHYDVNVMETH